MCKEFWIGVVSIAIGLILLFYLINKSENEKKPWDAKGYLGAIGSIVLGVYLIYESLILKNCC